MTAEQKIEEEYNKFRADNSSLEEALSERYGMRAGIVSSLAFVVQYPIWGYLIVLGTNAMSATDHIASGLVKIIAWTLFLAWSVLGIGAWFFDVEWSLYSPWSDEVVKYLTKHHKQSQKIRRLRHDESKRNEFFRFYELYKSDENFRVAYLSQITKRDEDEEFLKKLNK